MRELGTSRVTLNPAIWGHQKTGHSIQPRTSRSLTPLLRFWSVLDCGFWFYLPIDKVMLLLRLWESGNRGAISKAAQLPAFPQPSLRSQSMRSV
jgi:hypothetical protein